MSRQLSTQLPLASPCTTTSSSASEASAIYLSFPILSMLEPCFWPVNTLCISSFPHLQCLLSRHVFSKSKLPSQSPTS